MQKKPVMPNKFGLSVFFDFDQGFCSSFLFFYLNRLYGSLDKLSHYLTKCMHLIRVPLDIL